jgi:predicted metalloendopeptidase
MKALLIVMAIIMLGGTLIPVMHAVEALRTEASFTESASADYVTMMQRAVFRQSKQIWRLQDENAVLTRKLARLNAAATKPVASQP